MRGLAGIVFAIAVVTSGTAVPGTQETAPLQAGLAEIEITPPPG
jgi:hypothetical protein